ncbi:hypothetical protein FH972_025078 [Carpinus fangiana]|uniref:BTB domain-containing protein n=1 Tax=Carpinus fangiana TaxID=176857 RepID=A0A5N6L0A7_9ROSI|nr:hypothetical protein FH972_025078 [Carpinus fangiana]
MPSPSASQGHQFPKTATPTQGRSRLVPKPKNTAADKHHRTIDPTKVAPTPEVYKTRSNVFVNYRRPLNGAPPKDVVAGSDKQEPVEYIQEEEGVTLIAAAGDLILEVRQDEKSDQYLYRVQSSTLKSCSSYFDRLMGPTFQEGISMAKQHAQLTIEYGAVEKAPITALPRIRIEHIGQISTKVKMIHPLMTDLLAILHGRDTTGRKVPLSNLANLCVVADRFACLAPLSHWATRKGLLRPTASTHPQPSEDVQRQRIYAGLLLDYAPWVLKHSAQLLLRGSPRWASPATPPAALDPAWASLPRGVEAELQLRRACVLAALASLVEHCVALYAAPARQCKLGYDSSAQCDAFQLGQFVTQLAKKELLSLRARFAPPASVRADDDAGADEEDEEDADAAAQRDIPALIQTLREMPAYQIDANHAHCGPRKRLVAFLDVVDDLLVESSVGVCLECMRSGQPTHPADPWDWGRIKPLPRVSAHLVRRKAGGVKGGGGEHRHLSGYDLFLANEWHWAEGEG